MIKLIMCFIGFMNPFQQPMIDDTEKNKVRFSIRRENPNKRKPKWLK